jgi:ribosome-associated protein
MKEVEKNEIKRLSDRLDAIRHQQAGLSLVESPRAGGAGEKRLSKLKLNVCVASTARNSVKKHKSW